MAKGKKVQAQAVATPAMAVQPQDATQVATPVVATPGKVRYATRVWSDNWVIGNIIPNPKRGASQHRFALMANGQTVAQYCQAVVAAGLGNRALAQADLRWGTAPQRSQFTVTPPASE